MILKPSLLHCALPSLLLATSALLPSLARASDMSQATGEVYVEVIRLKDPNKIPGLTLSEVPLSVESVPTASGPPKQMARFRGVSKNVKGGNILYTIEGRLRAAPISVKDGSFEIQVPLSGREQIVRLRSIDDYGKVYDDAIRVRSEQTDQKKIGKRWNFDIGAAISYLDYHEDFRNLDFDVTELGLTVKAGVNYIMNKNFEIGGNTFVTAYPVGLNLTQSTTSTTTGAVTTSEGAISEARWFGINGRLGYRLPIKSSKASFHLMTGWYVWGMFVPATSPTATYGVQYLGGPQFFLTGRFQTKKKRAYAAYLKFATIQDQGFLSAVNRELAIGGAYQLSKPNEGYRRWMLTFDVAHAKFSKPNQAFSLLSASLGISTNL